MVGLINGNDYDYGSWLIPLLEIEEREPYTRLGPFMLASLCEPSSSVDVSYKHLRNDPAILKAYLK